jgi:hypothetical protein
MATRSRSAAVTYLSRRSNEGDAASQTNVGLWLDPAPGAPVSERQLRGGLRPAGPRLAFSAPQRQLCARRP